MPLPPRSTSGSNTSSAAARTSKPTKPRTYPTPTNTTVFIVFRDFNGALALCDFALPDVFTARSVPNSARISVVVIRTTEGKLYYGRQNDVVQPGRIFSPPLRETTAAELVADLQRI